MVSMREQERGECTICGRDCAASYGRVSKHGYTVEFGFFSGKCFGSDRAHYGSEEAKLVLADAIQSCEEHLALLPSIIANLENELAREPDLKSKKIIKNIIAMNNRDYVSIPLSITALSERLDNWKAKDTRIAMVDSQGRTAEEWVAIKQAQENKKAAKIEADKIKRERAEKAEENRMKKVVEYEALISSDNHYRLFYEGALIDSWVAAYDSEHDIYEAVRGKIKAHWLKVGHGGGFGFGENYKFFADGRTAAEGKGKRFFQYLVHGTAKAYFDNYSV